MIQEFVTLVTFNFHNEALPLVSHLESEGIECFLRDAETLGALPMNGMVMGGMRLQVRTVDAERAWELYQSYKLLNPRPTAAYEDKISGYTLISEVFCPQCESTLVYRKKGTIDQFLLSLLLVPLLFMKRSYRCSECGNEWKE